MNRPLRIAMLAHSTNPRGGVVHAMHLSEALAELGHEVTLFAPDSTGKGFFRSPKVPSQAFAVERAMSGMTAMVEQRIRDYVHFFERRGTRDFDLFHAHDGISGNALATLAARGHIDGFLRTVHHVDDFADPKLMDLQARSIDAASRLFTVSDHWRQYFRHKGRVATCVGNGVDARRFRRLEDESDVRLRTRLGITGAPIFLAVGGIEARKNTLNILKAFAETRAVLPAAQLVIAGGVSLLDHHDYQSAFNEMLASSPLLSSAVHVIGAVPDAEMPALYRMADALVFASLKEGFGLVVLEAMASGLPVVLSSMPPFTEYVPEAAAFWCDPRRAASIADGMVSAVRADVSSARIAAGFETAARHDWKNVAAAHLPAYRAAARSKETVHA